MKPGTATARLWIGRLRAARTARIEPGSPGFERARFTTVVLGQDQVGTVHATADSIVVTVTTTRGDVLDTITVPRRR